MHGLRLSRPLLGGCLVLMASLAIAQPVWAAWGGSGSGAASALADSMPSGNAPTAGATGTSVTLQWPTAYLPGNVPVAGYVIQRFNVATGAQAVVGAGCSGTVTTTTCVESNVPSGTWDYIDIPVQDNWTGGPSSASGPVTVS